MAIPSKGYSDPRITRTVSALSEVSPHSNLSHSDGPEAVIVTSVPSVGETL